MKGQFSIIESILAAIALFITFNIMISPEVVQTKWKDAINLLSGRDILITIDRLDRLHNYTFSQIIFNNEVSNKLTSTKDSIVKITASGTLKATTYVACNCTFEQLLYLQNVLSDVKFNNRKIDAVVCSTSLNQINSCTLEQKYPDILVIWGYKDLTQNLASLLDLLNNNIGIIEIADINSAQVDSAQQRIFGIKWFTNDPFPSNPDEFSKPRNVLAINYQSYKWFHHLPYSLSATPTGAIPVEGLPSPSCSVNTTGSFKFNASNNRFWICDATSVYWDTNGNNIADKVVTEGKKFSINASNFLLNYIDSTDKIRISFKPNYLFKDFLKKDETHNKLFPITDDKEKVLINMGFWDLEREKPIAVAILNGTKNVKTVWVADFSRNGLENTEDDHKQLIASLVLSLANKELKDTKRIGQIISYVNVVNRDMLEVYKIELTVGTPF